jgi:hypothetical protein
MNQNNGLIGVKVKTNLFPIAGNLTSCLCKQNCSIFRKNQHTLGVASLKSFILSRAVFGVRSADNSAGQSAQAHLK